MGDVSNKTLVGLLVVAIVVSLAGTFVSLSKLSDLSLSGLLTNVTSQSASTTAEVGALAEISLILGDVDFGVGAVDGNYSTGLDFCNLQSRVNATSQTGNTYTSSDVGANASPCREFSIPDSFEIENTGNVAFTNLTLSSTSGQTLGILGSTTAGNYSYTAFYDSVGTCAETPNTTGVMVAAALYSLCETFEEDEDDDAIAVQIEFYIGDDAPPGISTDTLTFTGTV